jgi:hypothetical protein
MNNTMRVQTINECQRGWSEINPAHSNDKPDASSYSTTKISVRFVSFQSMNLQIKNLMKTSVLTHEQPMQTPFADLMLHPDKLKMALKVARMQNDAFDASRRMNHASWRSNSRELKNTEFHLEAPGAQSVQLVIHFTDREEWPLDMVKSEDGAWFTIVPLPPGSHPYCFIIDGKRCDHPHWIQGTPNPSSTASAVANFI